jgi:hypothetical protein
MFGDAQTRANSYNYDIRTNIKYYLFFFNLWRFVCGSYFAVRRLLVLAQVVCSGDALQRFLLLFLFHSVSGLRDQRGISCKMAHGNISTNRDFSSPIYDVLVIGGRRWTVYILVCHHWGWKCIGGSRIGPVEMGEWVQTAGLPAQVDASPGTLELSIDSIRAFSVRDHNIPQC